MTYLQAIKYLAIWIPCSLWGGAFLFEYIIPEGLAFEMAEFLTFFIWLIFNSCAVRFICFGLSERKKLTDNIFSEASHE